MSRMRLVWWERVKKLVLTRSRICLETFLLALPDSKSLDASVRVMPPRIMKSLRIYSYCSRPRVLNESRNQWGFQESLDSPGQVDLTLYLDYEAQFGKQEEGRKGADGRGRL